VTTRVLFSLASNIAGSSFYYVLKILYTVYRRLDSMFVYLYWITAILLVQKQKKYTSYACFNRINS